MDLLQNSFQILTASPRDNRQRIIELADERSLLLDSRECIQARSDLTNPRKRLSAEVAWLPGISPKNICCMLSLLESSPSDLLGFDKLTSIAQANLLAAGLPRLTNYSPSEVAEWILKLAWTFEDLEPEGLSILINEERALSGFPEVTDLSAVEEEIQKRRRHYRRAIKAALDNLSAEALVEAVTLAVEAATDNGREQGPILLADLVDSYEVEAQSFLEKEEANIKTQVKKLQTAVDAEQPNSALTPIVDQLILLVKNWDKVAQPIQVSTKSRGLNHDASHSLANLVRNLAIHIYNKHDKLEISQQLTQMLQEVFAEVVDIAELTADDATTLNKFARQRARLLKKAKIQAKEWLRDITYETELGTLFKDQLRISPTGIVWKNRCWPLNNITSIRWGKTDPSRRGFFGTTYFIAFDNGSERTRINLSDMYTYNKFMCRLWKAIGVPLLIEYLEGLELGKKYQFGSTIISDYGIQFENKTPGSNTKHVFCRWEELVIWNETGFFCIEKKKDKRISKKFSYEYDGNIHILEAAISIFWERSEDQLSSLLSDKDLWIPTTLGRIL